MEKNATHQAAKNGEQPLPFKCDPDLGPLPQNPAF